MNNIHVAQSEKDRTFWLQWVLASGIGFGLFTALFGTLDAAGGEGSVMQVSGLFLGSAAFGLPQAFVLRNRLLHAGWWVLTPAIGLILGGVVGFPLGARIGASAGPPFDFIVAGVATLITAGSVSGLLQGLILRRLFTSPAAWVLVNCLAWLAGGLVSGAIGLGMGLGPEILQRSVAAFALMVSLVGFVGGAVFGAITGIYLVRLFQRSA